MFSFVLLVRRLSSSTSKRRIFDAAQNCPRLHFAEYSDSVTKLWQSDVVKDLRKIEENIAKYFQTTIRDIVRVLNSAECNGTLHEEHALILLKCCGDALPCELPHRRTEQARKIWTLMSRMQVQPNIHHYNAMLQVHLDNEHRFECREMMDEIHAHQLIPNQTTYELMFEQFCRFGSMAEAMRFIGEIKANECDMTEHIYCSMILGYARADDMTSAVSVPNSMKLLGVQQTFHTSMALMKCFARFGEIDPIIDVFNSYDHIEDEHMLSVITELCLNGHESKIASLVRRMQRKKGYHQQLHCTILKLISRDKIDGAYTLLKTMPRATLPNGQLIDIGNFFLKQMVTLGYSTNAIISMSHRISADGLHSRGIYSMLEEALCNGMVNISMELLKELRRLHQPIRQHYFWPLLCSEGSKGKTQLFEIIREMHNEFQQLPDAQSVTNFILPHLKKFPPEEIIDELHKLGIPLADVVPPVVAHCLRKHNWEEASKIAAAHATINYSANNLRNSLVTALVITKDVTSFARFVRIIHDSQQLSEKTISGIVNEEMTTKEMQLDTVGQILFDAIFTFRSLNSMDLILRAFIRKELLISAKQAQRIKTFISTLDLRSDILQRVDALVVPDNRISSHRYPKDQHKSRRIVNLMEIVECNDVDGAIDAWKKLKSHEMLNTHEMQNFVHFLQKNNRHKVAKEAIKQAVANKIHLSEQTWKDLLYRLANDGNVTTLDEFKKIDSNQSHVPLDILNNAICTAHTLNGKCAEYLTELENEINSAQKATNLQYFPLNSGITILSKYPELLDQYKLLVTKYLDKNSTVPLNALWMYYFLVGNDATCKQIWTNTLSMVPTFSFDCILDVARAKNDAHLIDRLLDFFRTEDIDKANWIVAYNALLGIHLSNHAFEKAKIVIEYAIWDDCYEQIEPQRISKIANGMTAMGQTFPYKLPTHEND